jgi:site-specific DNA-methyltransferase (adenine-specific)
MEVINGNNIDILKQYPDNHFDSVVTDPPYGLGKEPNATELMKDWIEKGYHEISGSGFMGKEWDAFVPQPIFWKEVFRVLKPGGHVLAFYGTRTYDWGVMAMRFAGFEVRDCIQWLYGCLSDDTEILTRNGYHKFKELPNFEEQEILIYDSENDIYKWEKPERWNEYNIHKDTCYRIESDNTDQIVSRNHRCLVEREGKLVFIQAEQLSKMEYMPTLSDDFLVLQESKVLQSPMQRILSGTRLEETRIQGKKSVVARNRRKVSVIKSGRKKYILERGNNVSQKERVLFGGDTEICEMSERVYSNGEERWVHSGISFSNGDAVGQSIIENGVRTSHRPQSNEQRHQQPDAICNEQGSQVIRVGKSYSTTLATITPIEYSGVIFCPTVSTGCFVARRNGKIFITGNSGFPKSHNISKAIDKMYGAERKIIGQSTNNGIKSVTTERVIQGHRENLTIANERNEFNITAPSTDQSKQWEGWGSSLKPANEPIVLARKPLEKGLSIAENVLKWGVGAINIDGCRVGFKNESDNRVGTDAKYSNTSESDFFKGIKNNQQVYDSQGRFPANLILSHSPECQHVGTKKVKSGKASEKGGGFSKGMFGDGTSDNIGGGYGDENGEETIEDWNCVDSCPIKILDEQSGESKSGDIKPYKQKNTDSYSGSMPIIRDTNFKGDKGGASRFFYVAKASKSERNKGLEGMPLGEPPKTARSKPAEGRNNALGEQRANFHPTVKPIKLMQYLVRLVTPPNGIVLDPFCGSGTTGVACKLENFQFVGLEQDAEYCNIAKARIDNFVEEKETKKGKKNIKPIQNSLFDA